MAFRTPLVRWPVFVGTLVLCVLGACGPELPDDLPGLMLAMGSNDMRVNFAAARRADELYGTRGLISALEHESANTRAVAAHFLQRHPGFDTEQALLAATRDSDAHVRMWAVFSLGKIGSQSVLERLRELEKDPESVVVRRVRVAIQEIQDRQR